MGCDFPLKAYRTEELSPSGKRLLTFNPLRAVNSTSPMEIPCNNCMGCKLERSRQWAVRMMHESKMHPENSFITLTYTDETVPQDYSLNLRHLQLFFKRLRKHLSSLSSSGGPPLDGGDRRPHALPHAVPKRIRFYACGEYGDLAGRPHYHAIIFNHDFPDKKLFKTINGKPHYVSEQLTNLWQLGHATTADVTFQSAAYCARYVTKKIKTNDEYGLNRYFRLSPIDGQYHLVKPEFSIMSRRPGIGHSYAQQFKSDFYPSGFIVVDGVKQAPPRYYVQQLTEAEQTKLKRAARRKSLVHKPHTTTERRLARAAVRDARIKNLKRNNDL